MDYVDNQTFAPFHETNLQKITENISDNTEPKVIDPQNTSSAFQETEQKLIIDSLLSDSTEPKVIDQQATSSAFHETELKLIIDSLLSDSTELKTVINPSNATLSFQETENSILYDNTELKLIDPPNASSSAFVERETMIVVDSLLSINIEPNDIHPTNVLLTSHETEPKKIVNNVQFDNIEFIDDTECETDPNDIESVTGSSNEFDDYLIQVLSRERYQEERQILCRNVAGDIALEFCSDMQHELSEAKMELLTFSDNIKENLKTCLKSEEGCFSLQQDLTRLYDQRYRTKSLCPLTPEVDGTFDNLYIPPELTVTELPKLNNSTQSFSQRSTRVLKMEDVFYRDSLHSKPAKSIYIVGESGIGKTSLCTKLVLEWSRLTNNSPRPASETTAPKQFCENTLFADMNFLSSFSFVFFIPLRDVLGLCDVDAMIKTHLLRCLSSQYTDEFLNKVLSEEQCLMIIDGLDEWFHPKNCFCGLIYQDAPNTRLRDNCTEIFTTRPWKMSEIRVKHTQIDSLVTIEGIYDYTTAVQTFAACLNQHRPDDSDTFYSIIERYNLYQIIKVPVLLLQILCLWSEEKQFGLSYCEMYATVVDMLLEWSSKVAVENQGIRNNFLDTSYSELQCLKGKRFCQSHIELLSKMGCLALNMIFEESENILHFDEGYVLQFIEVGDLKQALGTGILSCHKIPNCVPRRKVFYNFLHKSFQEFLAGLFLVANDRNQTEYKRRLHDYFKNMQSPVSCTRFFVFICGLRPDCAEKLCLSISENLTEEIVNKSTSYIQRKRFIKSLQMMIIKGQKECLKNYHSKTTLPLLHFIEGESDSYDPADKVLVERLVSMNKGKLQSLALFGGTKVFSDENVRCVDLSECRQLKSLYICSMFGKSIKLKAKHIEICFLKNVSETLETTVMKYLAKHSGNIRRFSVVPCCDSKLFQIIIKNAYNTLEIVRVTFSEFQELGTLDLRACHRLKCLDIGGQMSVLRLPKDTLDSLHIRDITSSAEGTTFKTLAKNRSDQLKCLEVQFCKQPDKLSKTIALLTITELYINSTTYSVDFGLPDSVEMVELRHVTFTGRSAECLVNRLACIGTIHSVECKMTDCIFKPHSDFFRLKDTVENTEALTSVDMVIEQSCDMHSLFSIHVKSVT
ncbi:hypothetical protein MAR_015140 [Mya arenaria]|uniref:NACHT domain-containing protein n=1 Tax=Mya arenaria TaxID=6604 RepID=A0ABY7FJS5_MYAAR|nr:hypothetical protein MAR_015140 [Mya arenaria]